MLEIAKDAIAELEDSKKGGTLDMDLIKKLTGDHSQRFEKEFMEDLRILNVRTPDALTRVSEYVPEIIEMTEKIMANGFAFVFFSV
jgi:cysteinyl-tRNA synthetase